MSVSVSRIVPESLTAYQVSMANASEIVGLLITLFEEKQMRSDATPVVLNDGPAWRISIQQPGYGDQVANIGDFIVVGFQGPLGPQVTVYPEAVGLDTFTANIPLAWAHTATPPVAVAQVGGKAGISFRRPRSLNGPWTYTVTQTNTTTQETAAASAGPPVVADDKVTLTVDGLTVGDDYTFTVTVSTQYAGVTATSVASNSITATT